VIGKAAHGVFIVTTATIGSAGSTSTDSTGARARPVRPAALTRRRLSTIAAPSNGVPSWNVTPSRAVILHSVNSSFDSTDSATYGVHPPLSVVIVRVS
jgi:hypothetical protein